MAATTADPRRRARLDALGIVPYRLRAAGDPAPEPSVSVPEAAAGPTVAATDPVPCVVLLPDSCPARELERVGRALLAFGPDFARAPRIQVPASGLQREPPPARAYLAFGEAQARALGQVMSAADARRVEVVLLDAPAGLGQGAAKRRLWQAVRALRRRLAEG